MKAMKKLGSFVEEFVATATGESTKALAIKAKRQSESALQVHVSIMKGDTIKLEDAVTSAEEAFKKARVNNGTAIQDRDEYIKTLIKAKNAVSDAEEELESHLETLGFLQDTLANLEDTVLDLKPEN